MGHLLRDLLDRAERRFVGVTGRVCEPELVEYLRLAVECCVGWFGAPGRREDPVGFYWWEHNWACAGRNPVTRTHSVYIPRDLTGPAAKAVLAHEVYHVVTQGRRGICRCQWVDEMLAELAAIKILTAGGEREYADDLVAAAQHHGWPPGPSALSPRFWGLRCFVAAGSGRIRGAVQLYERALASAIALESIVGWERMGAIPRCKTWREWLDTIPEALRSATVAWLAAAER